MASRAMSLPTAVTARVGIAMDMEDAIRLNASAMAVQVFVGDERSDVDVDPFEPRCRTLEVAVDL